MNYQGMKRLQAAIVISAIADYKHAYDYYQKEWANEGGNADYVIVVQRENARQDVIRLEKFFHSEWFEMINPVPSMSGDDILKHIRSDLDPELIIRCRRNILEGPRR